MEQQQRRDPNDAPPAYIRKPSLLEPPTLGPASQHETAPPQPQSTLPPSPAAEEPPTYTPLDEILHTFTLQPPFVYATGSSTFPRYHLHAEHLRGGKIHRLSIRRLLSTESRRLSASSQDNDPSCSASSNNNHNSGSSSSNSSSSSSSSNNISGHRRRSLVRYDDDMTLYTIESAPGLRLYSTAHNFDICGRQRGTLPGTVRLASESRGPAKFWHVTRKPTSDALRAEAERRMQKYGYHAPDEFNQELLFCVAGGGRGGGKAVLRAAAAAAAALEWRDEAGGVVAVESADAGLRIVRPGVDVHTRDLLVTCWLAKAIANGGVDMRGE